MFFFIFYSYIVPCSFKHLNVSKFLTFTTFMKVNQDKGINMIRSIKFSMLQVLHTSVQLEVVHTKLTKSYPIPKMSMFAKG